MNDDEVIYPGKSARLTASFGGLGNQPVTLGPSDVVSVTVAVTDPLGAVQTPTTPMSWDPIDGLWAYNWTAPADGASKMYRYVVTLNALDGSATPEYGEVWVEAPPSNPTAIAAQPVGVAPVSRMYLEPWCDESDIPPRRLQDSNGTKLTDINIGWMIAAATNLLYSLSGSKYRSGRSVVRPSILGRAAHATPLLYPFNSLGGWGDSWGFETGWLWPAIGSGWSWGTETVEVVLEAPVRRINNVIVDGVELDTNAYQVLDRRRLVRMDGLVWPTMQSITQDVSQPGTLQIDYEWGQQPPAIGRLACAELAVELALSFSGQDACKLPARVQMIATQGVNVAVGSSLDFLREMLTGLPICDLFLKAKNPARKRRRSAFLSPETVLNRTT